MRESELNKDMQLNKSESVIKQSRANLQTDFIVPKAGTLVLTNMRLMFIPDKFTNVKQEPSGPVSIDISDIKGVGKKGGDLGNLLAGSFRNRLQIEGGGRLYIFQVHSLNGWITAIEAAIRR